MAGTARQRTAGARAKPGVPVTASQTVRAGSPTVRCWCARVTRCSCRPPHCRSFHRRLRFGYLVEGNLERRRTGYAAAGTRLRDASPAAISRREGACAVASTHSRTFACLVLRCLPGSACAECVDGKTRSHPVGKDMERHDHEPVEGMGCGPRACGPAPRLARGWRFRVRGRQLIPDVAHRREPQICRMDSRRDPRGYESSCRTHRRGLRRQTASVYHEQQHLHTRCHRDECAGVSGATHDAACRGVEAATRHDGRWT